MKKIMGFAWSSVSTALVCAMLFFGMITPARAPKGGRGSLGGRTIASIQEEDFDKKLLNYQVCYGVSFDAGNATQERRRACKAMLVHKLEGAFAKRGTFLTSPVLFRCENTSFGAEQWQDWQEHPVVALHPNHEFLAIEALLARYSDSIQVDTDREQNARETCHFLSECKDALRFDHFSFRRVSSCLLDDSAERRTYMLDTIGNMLFRSKFSHERLLFAEILRN
jgi:hypothetical protein